MITKYMIMYTILIFHYQLKPLKTYFYLKRKS
jgi:hypothetical protein